MTLRVEPGRSRPTRRPRKDLKPTPEPAPFRVSREWVLAGHAVFTVEVPEACRPKGGPVHYTYRISKREPDGHRWDRPAWFAHLLTGPCNTADYTYLGMLDDFTGHVRPTRATSDALASGFAMRVLSRVLIRVWGGELAVVEAAGFKVHHEGLCGRCGAVLTVPASIESGFGPECIKRVFPGGAEPPPAKAGPHAPTTDADRKRLGLPLSC